MSTNCMFPLITYAKGKSPLQWGQEHGETYKVAIKELFEIRKTLMLAKNPALGRKLDELAMEQFEHSKKFAPDIATELEGIAQGSGLSLTDIVILNNYTDFRDIILPEEGCSNSRSSSCRSDVGYTSFSEKLHVPHSCSGNNRSQ